jgi:hypothetical protein
VTAARAIISYMSLRPPGPDTVVPPAPARPERPGRSRWVFPGALVMLYGGAFLAAWWHGDNVYYHNPGAFLLVPGVLILALVVILAMLFALLYGVVLLSRWEDAKRERLRDRGVPTLARVLEVEDVTGAWPAARARGTPWLVRYGFHDARGRLRYGCSPFLADAAGLRVGDPVIVHVDPRGGRRSLWIGRAERPAR